MFIQITFWSDDQQTNLTAHCSPQKQQRENSVGSRFVPELLVEMDLELRRFCQLLLSEVNNEPSSSTFKSTWMTRRLVWTQNHKPETKHAPPAGPECTYLKRTLNKHVTCATFGFETHFSASLCSHRHICADVTLCRCVGVARVPLCAVGLAPAGHRVADAGSGSRVHVLHHDEGMLLQGGHGQVTVIGHLLQEAAVPRPDRVADLKDPSSVRSHLERERPRTQVKVLRPGQLRNVVNVPASFKQQNTEKSIHSCSALFNGRS